jgi:outer membrane immunogenic protein
MKKLLLIGTAVAALMGGSALAADIPLKAPPVAAVSIWNGCYIGVNAGDAWFRQSADVVAQTSLNQAPGTVHLKDSSVIGGVHFGCMGEFTPGWVVGMEGDWSATRLRDTQVFPNLFLNGTPVGSGSITFSSKTEWLATARGRLGVVVIPNLLLYGTAGAAWNKTNYSGFDVFITPCPNCAITSFSSTKLGWVAGGGAEWAWTRNWLFRVEYLHYDISGAHSSPGLIVAPTARVNFTWDDLRINEVRAGLTYKF